MAAENVYVRKDGEGHIPEIFLPSATLDFVARHFNHDCSRGSVGIKTTAGGRLFMVLPLDTVLSQLRGLCNLEGNGSEAAPFILRVEQTGAVGGSGQAGAGAGIAACPDNSRDITRTLFAPFPEAEFPLQLEVLRLRRLLEANPVSPVYANVESSSYSVWPQEFGRLFAPDPNPDRRYTGKLARRLLEALEACWPGGSPSELLYTGFWNKLGFSLPEDVARLLEEGDVVINRNVQDASVTTAGAKRDYFVVVQNRLCVGGEDKPDVRDFQVAVHECRAKHRGANAALYGRLGYILLTVAAEWKFAVYGMSLSGEFGIQEIVPSFDMRSGFGRCRVLRTFMNITRWLRTIVAMDLLPPPPTINLFTPTERPSPYASILPEWCSKVTVTVRLRVVTKQFRVPLRYKDSVMAVYDLLQSIEVPNTIRVDNIQAVDDQLRGFSDITLTLWPVAACWQLREIAQLRKLCADVLATLAVLHHHNFGHCDIREDNILLAIDFMLIDYELALSIGSPVFWQPAPGRLPPGVGHGTPWEPWMDLWQLGRVLQGQHLSTDASTAFVQRLMDGSFGNANEAFLALQHSWPQ